MKIVKFFSTSVVATAVDFCLYVVLLPWLSPTVAHVIGASSGMIVNFVLQRRWVFVATRSVRAAFVLSLLFSLGGIALGTGLIYVLTHATFLKEMEIVAKLVTIAVVFFYNYLTKKIAFGDRS